MKTNAGPMSGAGSRCSCTGSLVNKFLFFRVIYSSEFGCPLYTKDGNSAFHRDIQTPPRRRGFGKYDSKRSIFDEIRGVWIADETLSRVFDISSQLNRELRTKRGRKDVKIYAN